MSGHEIGGKVSGIAFLPGADEVFATDGAGNIPALVTADPVGDDRQRIRLFRVSDITETVFIDFANQADVSFSRDVKHGLLVSRGFGFFLKTDFHQNPLQIQAGGTNPAATEIQRY